MNILITGIHGFIGSNLVTALKEQHVIYGLDIVSPHKDGVLKTYSWNEMQNIPAIDLVIHLAGKAHDTKNQADAPVYFEINTGLTQKIADWFLASTASKLIFFSSVKAAAERVDDEVLTENVIPSPKGPYGESKLAAERYLTAKLHERTEREGKGEEEMERGREEENGRKGEEATGRNGEAEKGREGYGERERNGEEENVREQEHIAKKIYILRPCMIHGPGNKGNLNLLYNVVKKAIPYPLGAFENKRSFTSVDNLCFVITQLIENDIPGGIYNVADDECLSTNELIALMAKTMSKPNRIWKWNKALVRRCAQVGTVLHLPLNTARLQKLTESYVVSNAKLKHALGIQNMPVPAAMGLQKTFNSFQKP